METVKEIREDGFVLNHSWYVDDFGLKRNSFDLFHEETRTHFPFFGPIRVTQEGNFLGDNTTLFTDDEYMTMLREQVEKIPPERLTS